LRRALVKFSSSSFSIFLSSGRTKTTEKAEPDDEIGDEIAELRKKIERERSGA
jgi:hypothetical protein